MARQGMVLFAHGARDVRWREPFDRLADKVRAARRNSADAGPVVVAFLELMEPDLRGAVEQLVAEGCGAVTVVPVFLGQGGHVRRDLPEVIERCRREFPSCEIGCATAVGEDEGVLDALAAYCLGL